MAETMSFALVGALILTLTLVPVLASYWFKSGVREHRNRAYEWMKRQYAKQLDWALARPKLIMALATLIFGLTLYADSVYRRRIYAAPGRGRTLGAGHYALHHLVRRGEQYCSPDSQDPDVVSASHGGRLRVGTARRWHRPYRLL